jgi:hypothetical protein
MIEQQFLLLIATVWIAPHVPRDYSLLVGLLCLVAACAKGMGLI